MLQYAHNCTNLRRYGLLVLFPGNLNLLGANDAEKLVKILHDISLNFKYSTLDKATGSFDEANKLRQGGFHTVYKGVLADGREIAVKRFRARIADFGLARSFQDDKSHISTAFAGTLGYMAPEYLAHSQLTEKADVYSFGVLVLEIVTRRQNSQRENAEYTVSLLSTAWEHFQRGTVEEIFDVNLMFQNHHTINVKNEVTRFLHVRLLCAQEVPTLRPSMSKALEMFVKKNEELPPPTKPPFVDEKTMQLHYRSLKQGDSATTANLSRSSFYPR
ncbi:Cysteine-rich receptor-like protein kinase 2 [Capsicum baccatum]|uniref:Cysteine-rich receptor-like protein kinase 2 n=1 Tax=Capsicum baccatum TaxID=33114 RepID=A0A2G2VPU1_CAPBA|nr:Cysteine-rich receptor-like protein kinase 2 [Capsicum baccatum]